MRKRIYGILFLLLFSLCFISLPLAQAQEAPQILKGEVLVQAAIDQLKAHLTTDYGTDLVVVPGNKPSDLSLPAGVMAYEVTFPYGIRLNMPTQAVAVVKLNDVVYSKIPFRMNVTVYQNVVVASRNILAGETLNSDNLKTERRDIGRIAGSYYHDNDLDKLNGLVVKRGLPEGTVLTDTVIDKPVLLKRGDFVTLVAHVGGVEVLAKGKCLQDGREGQIIRVQNVTTGKTLSGKVVDAATVDVSR